MTRVRVALVVLIWLFLTSVPQAHPTSSAFVVVEVPGDGKVRVDISADAEILARTLEGLGAQASDIVRLVDLEIDGRRVDLEWRGLENTPNRKGLITMHLAGGVTGGADAVRWRTQLFLGAYPLAVVRTRSDVNLDAYEWLAGHEWSREYQLNESGAPGWRGIARSAVRLIPQGFTHILPGGLDHVLFMLGLYLVATTKRAVILQVSLFTLAHSLTLALAVVGAVSVPARIVEPLIAASIAFIALENLLARNVSYGRLVAVFGFGLLHGLGFAGAMADLGLAGENLAGALVGFNIGVELGQLAVIAGAACIIRSLRLTIDTERQFVVRPLSAAIALTGLFWMVERTL
ncbi:MAG TPA: HupE/UreJ family protein [Vicinamibacterales bacterium]|nr:HupE/UreJ family protein [Vicinamibacterales bacterium]